MPDYGTKSAADVRAGLREAMRQAQRLRADAEDDPTDANLERVEGELRALADEARDASDADTDDDLQAEIDRAVDEISAPLDVNSGGGGDVDVAAHTRNGSPVSGYTRSKGMPERKSGVMTALALLGAGATIYQAGRMTMDGLERIRRYFATSEQRVATFKRQLVSLSQEANNLLGDGDLRNDVTEILSQAYGRIIDAEYAMRDADREVDGEEPVDGYDKAAPAGAHKLYS